MRCAIILFAIWFVPPIGFSATLIVPDDYPTIQQAIDAAVNGDTVLVAPDTYVENIDFLGKAITVMSSDGAAATIIDGGNPSNPDYGSVVTFNSGEGLDSVLKGFTITNGSGRNNKVAYCGGGIICNESSPTIKENIITGNTIALGAINYGGGIYSYEGSPTIVNNIIVGNSVAGAVGSGGGGIYCGTASPTIMNNTISKNKVTKGGGGGVMCSTSFPVIVNNVITNNKATSGGGGISLSVSSSLMVNNTISGNRAKKGGGIVIFYNDFTGTTDIANTILWKNYAEEGHEIFVTDLDGLSTTSIQHSDVMGGKEEVFVVPGTIFNWGEGMIDGDPLFVNTSNDDYHLTWLSPCINMGINNGTTPEDIDGDPRPCMGTVDIGADEFMGTHSLEADVFSLSESIGGQVNFVLHGGAANAGRNYHLLGSASGCAPGIPFPHGSGFLPINWDLFTNLVANLFYPDSIVFINFYGALDSSGQMVASFDTNGPIPGALGLTASFAYQLEVPPWDFASNPINIEVVQ